METETRKGSILKILLTVFVLIVALWFSYFAFFKAPGTDAETKIFTVALNEDRDDAIEKLHDSGFIKNKLAFRLVLGLDTVSPGGYRISNNLNVFSLVKKLKSEPDLKWIVLKEGLRKEEVLEILADRLDWDSSNQSRFIKKTIEVKEHYEGTLFPDTYLISKEESPEEVVLRMRRRFEEKFADLSKEAIRQNIRWPTVVKIASLIQREAAGTEDMPLISGIIWNRLEDGMKLDIDATLQYIKGNEEVGWWPKISSDDKNVDSDYNTYIHKGLPPTPIANPGLAALKSVLFPTSTECFYYLHAKDKNIYCAKTYEEHKKNIETYLR